MCMQYETVQIFLLRSATFMVPFFFKHYVHKNCNFPMIALPHHKYVEGFASLLSCVCSIWTATKLNKTELIELVEKLNV